MAEEELKTLKDLDEGIGFNCDDVKEYKKEIRAETVKWVKEDKVDLWRLHEDDRGTWQILLTRWMKRLNITEEDLK